MLYHAANRQPWRSENRNLISNQAPAPPTSVPAVPNVAPVAGHTTPLWNASQHTSFPLFARPHYQPTYLYYTHQPMGHDPPISPSVTVPPAELPISALLPGVGNGGALHRDGRHQAGGAALPRHSPPLQPRRLRPKGTVTLTLSAYLLVPACN